MIPPSILALFTQARRRHEGLAPRELEARLALPAGSVKACENQRILKADIRAKLIEFNKLEGAPSRNSAMKNDTSLSKFSCGESAPSRSFPSEKLLSGGDFPQAERIT